MSGTVIGDYKNSLYIGNRPYHISKGNIMGVVPGAIIGGLIIGVGEKVAEIYWGPAIGGAIENWFAYALALVFLLFRPQGLFGERIIERV